MYFRKSLPLFTQFHRTNSLKPLMQSGVRCVLKYAAEDAGVDKKVNPHAFRKARATELSQRLTPSELSVYHGWVQGSAMPKVYIHLGDDAVEKKLLKQAGILEDATSDVNPLAPRRCARCQEDNGPASRYCVKCTLPLDQEELMSWFRSKIG